MTKNYYVVIVLLATSIFPMGSSAQDKTNGLAPQPAPDATLDSWGNKASDTAAQAHPTTQLYIPPPGTKIPLPPRVSCEHPATPSPESCHFVK